MLNNSMAAFTYIARAYIFPELTAVNSSLE